MVVVGVAIRPAAPGSDHGWPTIRTYLPERVSGKEGSQVLLWWDTPDDRGVNLDVRAEDYTSAGVPFLLVFHAQPLVASRARSGHRGGSR